MHPKFKPGRTRIVILTFVCAIVCTGAALVAFEPWTAKHSTVGRLKTSPRANELSETEIKFDTRAEEASKSTRRKKNESLTPASSLTTSSFNPFELTPFPTPSSVEVEEQQREEEEGARGDQPDEAIKFRNLQLQDENGFIPIDGLQKAREQMEVMRSVQQKRAKAAGKPEGVEVARLDPGDWFWLGPGNVGGRIRSMVIHPTNANNMWVGSVSGGIWRSTNAGAAWAPVNDFMANLAVSTIVMEPTNANIMYAGTGEGFPSSRDNLNFEGNYGIQGAGVFKSTDGGTTWNQLASTAPTNPINSTTCAAGANCPWFHVDRLAVAPNGAAILAATGNGIWRSTDAGATWSVRPSFAGVILDIDFNPNDSQRAIAAQVGQIAFSTDGGQSWTNSTYSTDGGATFTASITGRAELAYAPSNPSIVYASVDDNVGDLYRSLDGGMTFIRVNSGTNYFSNGNGDQGGYDNIVWVNPQDATFVIVGGIDLWRSTDSGTTLNAISNWRCGPGRPACPAGTSVHADQHMIVAHPAFNNSTNKVVYFGNDGGLFTTSDVSTVAQTSGWMSLNNNLGITQFWSAAANSDGVIIAGAQDNGNSLFTGNANSWTPIATMTGDGGFCAADPTDSNYFYGEYINLQISRSTNGGITGNGIFGGIADANCTATQNCANFVAPFILDPNDPNTMLAGGINLWRSTDVKADTPAWTRIKLPASNGAIPPANVPISAIVVSPTTSSFIVVGHNDGQIYLTFDGSSAAPSWNRIDAGVPDRFVTRLVIDETRSPNWIYATLGGFSGDNVWRTTDLGSTWTDITGTGMSGLPDVPVRSLVINPVLPDLLYVGTEVGVFASEDAGATWQLPQGGPANVSVDELFWLKGDLVAVTHGRGLFKTATSVYDLPQCTAPTNECQCIGFWDCPCFWNNGRIPTVNDDIVLSCSMTIRSTEAQTRNLRVNADLHLLNGHGVSAADGIANFGAISSDSVPGSGLSARNLLNSRPANTVTTAGVISVSQISVTDDVVNGGIMAVGHGLDCGNLRTTPDSTLALDTLTVRGNLINNSTTTIMVNQLWVLGDLTNTGSINGNTLFVSLPGIHGGPHVFSGSGVWKFALFGIPAAHTVTLGNDITFDITNFFNDGTLDLQNRTLTFTGQGFSNTGSVAGTGTFRFLPAADVTPTFASGQSFTAGVRIVSGTVDYRGAGVIGGPLTIDAAGTLGLNNSELTANGDVLITGTLKTLGNPGFGTSIFSFNGSSLTNAGAITQGVLPEFFFRFNTSGAARSQTIVGTGSWSPRVLQIGASTPALTTVTLMNDVTFSGSELQIGAGSLNLNNHTLTFTGTRLTQTGSVSGMGAFRIQPANGTATLSRIGSPTFTPELRIASGTVTAGPFSLDGPLTVDAGATLINSGIGVKGNVTINGVVNQSGSSFFGFSGTTFTNNGSVAARIFLGASFGPRLSQNLAGAGLWTGAGNTLLVSNLSTVTLLNDLTYSGGTLFIDGPGGILNTGAFTLSLPCTTLWQGAGDVIGNIRRTNLAACPGAIAFGNPFTTIQFTSGTPPTEMTVNVGLAAPFGFPNAAMRTYLITPTGGSGYAATLRLHYLDSELNGNSESTLQLWRNNGSSWTAQGATNRNTTENWVEFAGVTQFSPWTISGAAGPAVANISGTLLYVNGTTPVTNVTMTLTGPTGFTPQVITTDSTGSYSFPNVPTGIGRSYTLTPTKSGDVNGITAFDASLAARFAAGLITLTANQQVAADASNNGSVSAFDASLIARTAAGIANPGIAGTWKFLPASIAFNDLSANQSNQNITAILIGDVSGDWAPASLLSQRPSLAAFELMRILRQPSHQN